MCAHNEWHNPESANNHLDLMEQHCTNNHNEDYDRKVPVIVAAHEFYMTNKLVGLKGIFSQAIGHCTPARKCTYPRDGSGVPAVDDGALAGPLDVLATADERIAKKHVTC
jgi:hypothetical protein